MNMISTAVRLAVLVAMAAASVVDFDCVNDQLFMQESLLLATIRPKKIANLLMQPACMTKLTSLSYLDSVEVALNVLDNDNSVKEADVDKLIESFREGKEIYD